MTNIPTPDELESLFVNNEYLDRIAAYLNRFNPIRTMRMEHMEIRHSAILAWLLDPSETHGFSDRFLKAFIGEALRGRSDLGYPTALKVSQSDMRDAEIRREWQNIDLLIVSRRNDWAFIIENKFNSRQHQGQLAKYASRVTAIYGQSSRAMTVRGIFLTLNGEEPEDERYAPITYASIVELLPRLMAIEGQTLGQEVASFLRQYLEVLKDATGMSDELEEMALLARQLYRTHRKSLDFIIEHGASTDFSLAVETLFGATVDYGETAEIDGVPYMYAWHNADTLGLMPCSWRDALGGDDYVWPGCENWQAEFPIAIWLHLTSAEDGVSGSLRLVAEVGPASNYECRAAIIDGIKKIANSAQLTNFKFQRDAAAEGRRYSRFMKRNSVQIHDISDAAEIADAMRKALKPHHKDLAQLTPALEGLTKFAERA